MEHPVYLVRHGESEWNVRRLTQGQTPHPPLTHVGREQACTAAELIAADLTSRGLRAKRVVTSDLRRAVETASIVGERLGARMELDARLREQHLGWLEGRGYDETWAATNQHDWSDPTLPLAGGESVMEVRNRMAAVLDGLDPAVVTVVISHGDAIRAAVAHLSGHLPHEAAWVDVPNGAVVRCDGALTWL